MAYVHKDRVSESTTTSGTANLVVGGALPGARSFAAALTDGDQFVYCLEEGTAYEIADGTWNSATSTITRGTLHSSSTGAKLNLTGSGATVMLIVSSKWIQELEATIAAHAADIAGNASEITALEEFHTHWDTTFSGHLVPASHNTRDIGTSSIRPRNLYLAGNAIVAGSATFTGAVSVQGLDVISNFLALGSAIDGLVAIFSSVIADGTYVTAGGDEITVADGVMTEFSQGAGGASDSGNFIVGLLISSHTDTAHDLEITAGRCASSDGAAIITSGSAVVIAIDNASHRVDGSTLDADTDYYVLAGMDSGAFVAGFSKVESLPSGWDCYRAIGVYRTDGSSNLPATSMDEDETRFVLYDAFTVPVVYSSGSFPTAPGSTIDTGVPTVSKVKAFLSGWAHQFAIGNYLNIHPGTRSLPASYAGTQFTWRADSAGTTNIYPAIPHVMVETSGGGVWFRSNNASMSGQLLCYGYKWSPF